jgi:Major Facilitator Superfamily
MSTENEGALSFAIDDAVAQQYDYFRNQEQHDKRQTYRTQVSPTSGDISPTENSDSEEDSSFDDERSTVFKGQWLNTPRPVMIILMHFVFTLSQGIIMTSVIDVLKELVCHRHFGNGDSLDGDIGHDTNCQTAEVTGRAATFASYRTIIVAALSVFVVPRIAAYSDRHGRKWILVWCGLCLCLCDALTLACVKFPNVVDYHFLLLASVFQGVGGNLSIIQVLNVSYVSDCTDSATRTAVVSILDAMLFGGLAVGPTLGSLFLQRFGHLSRLFATTLSMNLACLTLVVLLLPESRAPKSRRSSQAIYDASRHHMRTTYTNWQKHMYRMNFLRPLGMLMFRHLQKRQDRRNARALVAIGSICLELSGSLGPILLFYVEDQFRWTSIQTGYMMSAAGLLRALILGVIFPMTTRYLIQHKYQNGDFFTFADLYIIRIALSINCIAIFLVSVAPSPNLFAAAVVFDALAAALMPTVKNSVIKHAQESQVGELLGALNLLTNIGMIVIPFIFFTIFRYTITSQYPSIVFQIVSGLFCTMLTCTLLLYPRDYVSLEDIDEPTSSYRYGTL